MCIRKTSFCMNEWDGDQENNGSFRGMRWAGWCNIRKWGESDTPWWKEHWLTGGKSETIPPLGCRLGHDKLRGVLLAGWHRWDWKSLILVFRWYRRLQNETFSSGTGEMDLKPRNTDPLFKDSGMSSLAGRGVERWTTRLGLGLVLSH